MRQVSPDGMLRVNERCKNKKKPSALQCRVRYSYNILVPHSGTSNKTYVYRRAEKLPCEKGDLIMGFKTDIEIAQECQPELITKIAAEGRNR